MAKPFRQELDSSVVTYSGVGSDGSVTVTDTDTPVLVATVPFTTGPMPLSSSNMWAMLFYSFVACTADGENSFTYSNTPSAFINSGPYPLYGYQGGSPPTQIGNYYSEDGYPLEYYVDPAQVNLGANVVNTEYAGDFAYFGQFVESVNGSGDVEITLTVPTSIGQSVILRDFRIKAIIFGSL